MSAEPDFFRVPGKHNPVWKEWGRIARGKEPGYFLEHPDAVLESLADRNRVVRPSQVLLTEEAYQREPDRWRRLAAGSQAEGPPDWFLVPERRLQSLTSVQTLPSLCGLYRPREWSLPQVLQRSFLLVCCGVSDPGNLGTLLRSCRALAHDSGVLQLGGCQPWTSKVARASAGALLRIPLLRLEAEQGPALLDRLKQEGFFLFAALPQGGKSPQEAPWSGRDAVLLGNESRGVGADLEGRARPLTIPMAGETESLNVAVAGALIAHRWQTR